MFCNILIAAASPSGINLRRANLFSLVNKPFPPLVRARGGRGFGFTGLHRHENLENDSFRTVLLNAVAWVAGLEIPEDGVPSKTVSETDLNLLIIEAEKVREDKIP